MGELEKQRRVYFCAEHHAKNPYPRMPPGKGVRGFGSSGQGKENQERLRQRKGNTLPQGRQTFTPAPRFPARALAQLPKTPERSFEERSDERGAETGRLPASWSQDCSSGITGLSRIHTQDALQALPDICVSA